MEQNLSLKIQVFVQNVGKKQSMSCKGVSMVTSRENVPAVVIADTGKKFCIHCGGGLKKAGDKFCIHCGKSQVEKTAEFEKKIPQKFPVLKQSKKIAKYNI